MIPNLLNFYIQWKIMDNLEKNISVVRLKKTKTSLCMYIKAYILMHICVQMAAYRLQLPSNGFKKCFLKRQGTEKVLIFWNAKDQKFWSNVQV